MLRGQATRTTTPMSPNAGECLHVGGGIFSVSNGIVLLALNHRRAVNQIFFATSFWIGVWCMCVATAIHKGTNFDGESADDVITWLKLTTAAGAFFGWFVWMMRCALINDERKPLEVARKSWPVLCICLAAAWISLTDLYIPPESTPLNKKYGPGYAFFLIAAAVSCTWFFIDAIRNARRLSGIRKIEMQLFMLNLVCACLLVLASNLAGAILGQGWLKKMGAIWFIVLHTATVWALCYYRVFDAKQLIYSIGQRAALSLTLAITVAIIFWTLGASNKSAVSMFFAFFVTCILAVLVDRPIRQRFGLDQRQQIKEMRRTVIDWSGRISDEDSLREKFANLIRDWSNGSEAELLIGEKDSYLSARTSIAREWVGLRQIVRDGWCTPESLQRAKLTDGTAECSVLVKDRDLGAILAVPRESKNPTMLILLGAKYSTRPFTFPELQVLLEIAELMDNILTHSRVAAHAAKIEKMEAAAMMSRGLAHDLNNLTTPVASFLQHMEVKLGPNCSEANVLSHAKHSVNVMQHYIRESLFFASRLQAKIEWVDVKPLMISIARVGLDRAEAGQITISANVPRDFQFSADSALIQRLVQNLVSNAIDASRKGGRIEITAECTAADDVIFGVQDNGVGIPEALIDKIFEPYFTTRDTGTGRRGVGLGLAICRKVVDLYGGSIKVHSAPGVGTHFFVTLPGMKIAGRPASIPAPSRAVPVETGFLDHLPTPA